MAFRRRRQAQAGELLACGLPSARPSVYPERAMYEDFVATDRWTSEKLHCVWKGTVVAIATRHADATDIRFSINGKPVWIAMPNQAWVEQKRRSGKVITDYLAAQVAGRRTAGLWLS